MSQFKFIITNHQEDPGCNPIILHSRLLTIFLDDFTPFPPNSLSDNDLLPVPLRKQKQPEDILYKPQPYPAIRMIMYQYTTLLFLSSKYEVIILKL